MSATSPPTMFYVDNASLDSYLERHDYSQLCCIHCILCKYTLYHSPGYYLQRCNVYCFDPKMLLDSICFRQST